VVSAIEQKQKAPASSTPAMKFFRTCYCPCPRFRSAVVAEAKARAKAKTTATHGGFNRVSLQFYYKLYIVDPLHRKKCSGVNDKTSTFMING